MGDRNNMNSWIHWVMGYYNRVTFKTKVTRNLLELGAQRYLKMLHKLFLKFKSSLPDYVFYLSIVCRQMRSWGRVMKGHSQVQWAWTLIVAKIMFPLVLPLFVFALGKRIDMLEVFFSIWLLLFLLFAIAKTCALCLYPNHPLSFLWLKQFPFVLCSSNTDSRGSLTCVCGTVAC